MAEKVIVQEPMIELPAGSAPVAGGVEYHFPVEIEVSTALAAAHLDRAVQMALASLASAVRSA